MTTVNEFPKLDIDAKKKDKAWGMSFARAAFDNYHTGGWGSLFANRNQYREFADYALSKQSVERYKRMLKVDESPDPTFQNLNWTPLPILPKILEIALAITKKADFDIVATPIDPMSKRETQRYFAEQEAKIRIRKELDQMAPGLSDRSPIAKKEGDPSDLAELEIQRMFTYKHAAATEIEQFLAVVALQNNMEEIRAEIKRSTLVNGIAAVKEYVDTDGLIRIRNVNPSNMICSRVVRRDFKDAAFIGEVIEVNPADLIEMASGEVTPEQIKDMRNGINRTASAYGLPVSSTSSSTFYDGKIRVLDLEWIAYDPIAMTVKIDKYGNSHVARTSPEKASKIQYVKTIYKIKWVVGTDICFDFGKVTNMKRKASSLAETSLSYHVFAPNFDYFSMSAVSKVEQVMGIVDQINLSWYQLQHAIAKSRPRGVTIEVGALEDVNVGKGGKALTPKDLIEVYNQTGNIYFRQKDMDGNMSNYRPITELQGGMGQVAQEFLGLLQYNIGMLKEVIGINDATDGFTGSRSYSAAVNAGVEATNNALYSIIETDREILQSMADALVLRIQSLVRSKNVNPVYEAALGKPSLDFFRSIGDLSAIEFGVSLDPRPTETERQLFLQDINKLIDTGQVDVDDAIYLRSIPSLKAAMALLAYKVKTKREKAFEQQQQMMMQNAQAQQESAMISEQAKQQTLQLQAELDTQILQMKHQHALELKQMDMQIQAMKAQIVAAQTMDSEQLKSESKEYIAELAAETRKNASQGSSARRPSQTLSDSVR
jgi:hypothetical protein